MSLKDWFEELHPEIALSATPQSLKDSMYELWASGVQYGLEYARKEVANSDVFAHDEDIETALSVIPWIQDGELKKGWERNELEDDEDDE